MTREPYTIQPDLALESVGKILAKERFGALPVVDRANCLLGIISYVDVLQALLNES